MSSISTAIAPPAPAPRPSFLDRLNLSPSNGDEGLTAGQIAARDEIATLEAALQEETENADAPRGAILSFIADRFQDENSDTAVAYLLDLANRQITGRSGFDVALDSDSNGLNGLENRETPLTVSSVLDLALDTQSLLRESRAPIGLRLSILADLQNGLREIEA